MAEWFKALVLKTSGGKPSVSSNLTASANLFLGIKMSLFNELSDSLRKVVFLILFVMFFGGIFLLYKSYEYDKETENLAITVERVTGDYVLTDSTGPSPFKITVKDLSDNKVYEDSFVSDSCPLYSTMATFGKQVVLTRFLNLKIADPEVKKYFFKGAYEQFCTNQSFDPKVGENYYH